MRARQTLVRTLASLVPVAVAATLLAGPAGPSAAASHPTGLTPISDVQESGEVAFRLASTPEQEAEWRALTNTPEKRAALVAGLRESLAGVAEVHTSPTSYGKAGAVPNLAYGYDGHFWLTMSYGDAARGLIPIAVGACSTRLPGWVCAGLGNLLRWLVSGWGWANNHGVWGAAYWSGYVTGGRW